MRLRVNPGGPLRGEIHLPGDKSLSHRAALFASLAEGESQIDNFLVAGVTQAMLENLAALGVSWQLSGACLRLSGVGLGGFLTPALPLDCGHSATTLRLLAGALAATGIPASLDGSPGLRRRPMERVVAPLQAMGVPIEASAHGGAPLTLQARPRSQPLQARHHRLPVASAQVKTALLLAGLAADGPTFLVEPGPSRDHSERMLSRMGARLKVQRTPPGGGYARVTLYPPETALRPIRQRLPGDFSAAAFLIVAALILPGSEIRLRGVGLNPSRTGLLEALQTMGAHIHIHNLGTASGEPVGDLDVRHSRLSGIAVDGPLVVRMIDEFPAFALAATQATRPTRVRSARELRFKESDRIASLAAGLGALGVRVAEVEDGFDLPGRSDLAGGEVTPSGDHRLAMTLAIAGLAARAPVLVQDAQIVDQSFPDFVETLQSLGADVEAIPDG